MPTTRFMSNIPIFQNLKEYVVFYNNSGFYYTIEYYRNGTMIGKFRFNN